MKKKIVLICATILVLILTGITLLSPESTSRLIALAKESLLKIFVNEIPSKVKTLDVKGTRYVPLYFPWKKARLYGKLT